MKDLKARQYGQVLNVYALTSLIITPPILRSNVTYQYNTNKNFSDQNEPLLEILL